tara:strand:- start:716 stop:1174 length:459 start_codon:yes stop_codon:yes gene_type:complete
MTIEHKNIANAELHETKGVSAATTDKILHASTGTGLWKFQEFALNITIPDIVANQTYYLATPYAGTITSITSVIDNAFATADCTITARIGTTAVTSGAITITQSGSAAGNVDTATPSGANTLTAGQAVNFVVTGSNSTATACTITVIIRRTA